MFDQGMVPLLSTTALHHLHIFIFVLAVVHVTFCALTILFGGVKVYLHSCLINCSRKLVSSFPFGQKRKLVSLLFYWSICIFASFFIFCHFLLYRYVNGSIGKILYWKRIIIQKKVTYTFCPINLSAFQAHHIL